MPRNEAQKAQIGRRRLDALVHRVFEERKNIPTSFHRLIKELCERSFKEGVEHEREFQQVANDDAVIRIH